MRFKIHNVGAAARAKGFRRNHTYDVRGFDLDANPERGPLLLLRNRAGKTEGFYPDQGRWVDRGPPVCRRLSKVQPRAASAFFGALDLPERWGSLGDVETRAIALGTTG